MFNDPRALSAHTFHVKRKFAQLRADRQQFKKGKPAQRLLVTLIHTVQIRRALFQQIKLGQGNRGGQIPHAEVAARHFPVRHGNVGSAVSPRHDKPTGNFSVMGRHEAPLS